MAKKNFMNKQPIKFFSWLFAILVSLAVGFSFLPGGVLHSTIPLGTITGEAVSGTVHTLTGYGIIIIALLTLVLAIWGAVTKRR